MPAPVLGPPKTESSNRTIPLALFCSTPWPTTCAGTAGPGELVLRSPAGLPLDSNRFGHQWRRACRTAGASGLGYYALRDHTFASTLLSRGVSVKAEADWLGHASPTITLSSYSDPMPADEDHARAVLDAALARPAASPRPVPAEGLG